MKSRPASTHGFALVIALSLMAFILLLILSITTLVRVETQSANIQLAQLEARMNAQLGAMVALGDLQRYTGPDQRVTARADILFGDDDDVPGQSRWTGVWSSKDSNPDEAGYQFDQLDRDAGLGKDASDPPKHKVRWLVSGNYPPSAVPSALTLDPSAQLASSVETIELAEDGSSVTNKSNQDYTVKAPRVEILGDNNSPVGHYAYWVSDEGVKARVNMADPFLDSTDSDEEYYRVAMAQVADPTAVTQSESDNDPLLDNADNYWKKENQSPDQSPDKISSLKNLTMFLKDDFNSIKSEDPEVFNDLSREFFHDFTVHSSGVIANTKDGGLKRDLSTALLDLPKDMQEDGENSPMFPPANGPSGPGQMNPGGPKWEQLADYYRMASGLPVLDADGKEYELPSAGSIKLRIPTNEQVGFTPVITRSNFFVQGFAERDKTREASIAPNQWCLDTTGKGRGEAGADWADAGSDWYYARGYRYSLGMFPLITLWNPYDREMELEDLGLEFELPRINIVHYPQTKNKVSVSDAVIIAEVGEDTSTWNGKSSNGAEEVHRHTVKFVIKGVDLQPGEAVNFSPPCNSYYDKLNPSNNVLVARKSAPYVTGFFTPSKPKKSGGGSVVFWGNYSGEAKGPPARWMITGTGRKSRLTLQFAPGNDPTNDPSLWRQLVMLYSSTELKNSQFLSKKRIKAIDISATGLFESNWQKPWVIPTERLAGITEHIKAGPSNPNYRDPFDFVNQPSGTSYLDDFVGPIGDSASTVKLGSINLIEGNTLSSVGKSQRNPWGACATMRFPDVPIKDFAGANNELEMHLFSNMNPTAPVIDKEPNYTWSMDGKLSLGENQVKEGMSELNVYSKGHLAPWVGNPTAKIDYYDEVIAEGTDEYEAYVGLSNNSKHGSQQAVLFEVPDSIPLSIGQLAHANLMNHDVLSTDPDELNMINGYLRPAIGNVVNKNGNNSHTLQSYATPTYAIGNSLASPFLPLNRTEQWFSSVRKSGGAPAATYDYSYKLNDALWDEYFFSGITDTDAKPEFPLPNSRLSPSNPAWSNSDLVTENRAAANLLLDGAFNINSTSVAAWESVLGAMRDIKMLDGDFDSTLRHNFARFKEPLEGEGLGLATTGESPPKASDAKGLAAGYRNLTDAQIAKLASKIVDEIRLRKNSATGDGFPFLSLSEFINRSPQSNTQAFAWRGALQASIDKADLNGLESDNTGLWAESAKYPLYYDSGDTPIIERPKADGMPGAFMQSDLLAKIGAFIQARSDTFTIRSYGSSQEQFGSEEGSSAYYEMVVQRTPAYVEQRTPANVGLGNYAYQDNDADGNTLLTIRNQEFGRKYEIKSQRWVAADEI